MMAAIGRSWLKIDWLTVQRLARRYGVVAFAFAAGGWVASIRDDASQIPYQKRSTNNLEQVQAVAGPNPVATVKCLHRKADKAEDVAAEAVVSSVTDAPAPNLGTIPVCPPVPGEDRSKAH